MRASLWIAVASLFAVSSVGCGGGKRDSAAAVATTGALVGSVLELDGEVTATRGGATRPLAVGARVHDDDVIATGTGRVAIQLDRNQVVWRLGPRLSQQVAQSSAWSAPTATANTVATTDEHSAAAGRHAEREAADTAASAVDTNTRAPGAAQAAAATAAPAAAAPIAPPTREERPADAPKAMSKGSPVAAMAEPVPPPPPPPSPAPVPDPSGGLDDVSPKIEAALRGADDGATARVAADIDSDGAAGGGRVETTRSAKVPVPANDLRVAPPPSGGGGLGAPTVGQSATVSLIRSSGGLSTAVVTPLVRARQRQLAACGKGEAAGIYRVAVTVGANGKVNAVDTANASTTLATCARDALKSVHFDSAKTSSKISLALTIK